MKIFADNNIKQFLLALTIVLILSQFAIWLFYGEFPFIFILQTISILTICFLYFHRQNKIIETAVQQIYDYLDGDTNIRIDCDKEGELYHLFHMVNLLAAILNAHAVNQLEQKEFLKNIISDISHQLKTPLTALSIYNGLLRNEAENFPTIQEFAILSEQEIDRIESLIQNLLKIAKLDAGSITFEKHPENIADMMKDIELHFAYRTKQEQKQLILSGANDISLICDRSWMIEAIGNIVKNALDHTKTGSSIYIEWKTMLSVIQISVRDNGCGIHPEDLHHIFKRFYRSRFSKDTRGIGLGLPLAKAVIEAHNGTIEVNSQWGTGTAFVMNFLIPTKL